MSIVDDDDNDCLPLLNDKMGIAFDIYLFSSIS